MNRYFRSFAGNGIEGQYPLTDDQIMKVAPSIFAEEKHDSRSERYQVIPTIEVIAELRKNGFQPFMVTQARTRDESKREHAKHLLRLRHESVISEKQANEIILVNSHDGSCSYQMMAGVFRFVCSNGMVAGDVHENLRIRHSGNVIDNVIEGAFKVLDDFKVIDERRELMQSIELKDVEQLAFGRAALQLKYDTETQPAPVTESAIIQPRRIEDQDKSLWTVFNRVQENMIKGGLRARAANGSRTQTRPVNGIDGNIRLNKALWTLADEMAKLKT